MRAIATVAALLGCLCMPARGTLRAEIHLTADQARKELVADRYRILDNDLPVPNRVAVAACLRVALMGTRQRIVDPQLGTDVVYRTPFRFPVESDPIYRFLKTGDYKLIVGNVPPLEDPSH